MSNNNKIIVRRSVVKREAPASVILTTSRPRTRRARARPRPSKGNGADQWIQTLNDPFEYGPTYLGFNCMVPTVLGTAYQRQTLTVNADGSFGLYILPDATYMVGYNNAGVSTATWNFYSGANVGTLSSQMYSARVVSGGIRCFVAQAATDKQGVLYAGSQSVGTRTSLSATTIATLINQSDATLGIGRNGAGVTIRPTDVLSAQFRNDIVNGYSASVIPTSSIGYIVGVGFPATATVYFEAVLNFEGIPQVSTSAIGIDSSEKFNSTPAGYKGTFEAAWDYAKSFLSTPVIMEAAAFAADSMGSPGVSRSIRAVRGMTSMARATQRGRHVLVAGQQATSQNRQNTIVIEEMKDDF